MAADQPTLVYRVKTAGYASHVVYFRSMDRALSRLHLLLRRRVVAEYSVRAILADALPPGTHFVDDSLTQDVLVLRRPKSGCKQRSARA